jgi:hypothetical protein
MTDETTTPVVEGEEVVEATEEVAGDEEEGTEEAAE